MAGLEHQGRLRRWQGLGGALFERLIRRVELTPLGEAILGKAQGLLDDAAAHDVYQEHALHQEFIQRNKPHWARVQVYDFIG